MRVPPSEIRHPTEEPYQRLHMAVIYLVEGWKNRFGEPTYGSVWLWNNQLSQNLAGYPMALRVAPTPDVSSRAAAICRSHIYTKFSRPVGRRPDAEMGATRLEN